jgi:hypothetical protein
MYVTTTKSYVYCSNNNGFFCYATGMVVCEDTGKTKVFFLLSHIQHITSDMRNGDFFPQTQAISSPADTNWVS